MTHIVALNMHAWFHLWSEFDQWARSAPDSILQTSDVPDELAAAAEAAAAFSSWGPETATAPAFS